MQIVCFEKNELIAHLKNAKITFYSLTTPAGNLLIKTTELGILGAEFTRDDEKLYPFFDETKQKILVIAGTSLQLKVWKALCGLSKTISYKELAQHIGYPKAHRAVANAVAANKIAYFIPCHKIIRSDGTLGGYTWGIERKRKLLETR